MTCMPQFVQKRDSNYSECKEETVWSMERFNAYVNEHYAKKNGVEHDWVFNTLTVRAYLFCNIIFI